jgi:hypothetical protein
MSRKEWLEYLGVASAVLFVNIGLMCLMVWLSALIWKAVTR